MDLKTILVGFATVVASICIFAALVLYAMSKIGENNGGGVSEAKMLGLGIAGVAATAAAIYIGTQDLTIGG